MRYAAVVRWVLIAGLTLSPLPVLACAVGAAVLVDYSIEPVELQHDGDVPRLRLHADACVEVIRPGWYRDAGHYQLQLNPNEFQDLLQNLATEAFRFDRAAVKRQVEEAQKQRAARAAARQEARQVSMVADGEVSRFRIAVDTLQAQRWRLGDGRAAQGEFHWHALKHDATFYAEVPELAALARAELRLLGLMQDTRLQRVSD